MSEQCRAGLGALLSELVSTYSLLHQVPHCYSLLLQLNAQSPQQLIDMLALPDCSHRYVPLLHDAVSSLHLLPTALTRQKMNPVHVMSVSQFYIPTFVLISRLVQPPFSIDVRPVQKALISLWM